MRGDRIDNPGQHEGVEGEDEPGEYAPAGQPETVRSSRLSRYRRVGGPGAFFKPRRIVPSGHVRLPGLPEPICNILICFLPGSAPARGRSARGTQAEGPGSWLRSWLRGILGMPITYATCGDTVRRISSTRDGQAASTGSVSRPSARITCGPVGALNPVHARDLALCSYEVRGLGGSFILVDESAHTR
jgi:hypothetical protein